MFFMDPAKKVTPGEAERRMKDAEDDTGALMFKRQECLSEKQFRSLFGRFCAQNKEGSFDVEESPGVGLTDYLNFYQVLYSINEIDTALQFYHIAGAPIEKSTLKHVAKTVAHVELSDHLVEVVIVKPKSQS